MTEVAHVVPARSSLRRWLAAAALVVLSLTVPAFAVPMKAGSTLSATVAGNTTTFSVLSNGGAVGGDLMGYPVGSPTTMQVPPGWATGHANGGTPSFSTTGKAPVPGTASTVPYRAEVPVSKASMAGAIGRFAAKVAYPLTVGMAVYDLAKEFGWIPKWHEDAKRHTWEEHKRVIGYYADCGAGPSAGRKRGSAGDIAAACAASFGSNAGYEGAACDVVGPRTLSCSWRYNGTPEGVGVTLYPETETVEVILKSDQEFIDRIAAESGWPSASAISRALAEAVKAGESVETAGPPVVKPAEGDWPKVTTLPPVVTTTDNGDGTRTEKTSTTKQTYSQPSGGSGGTSAAPNVIQTTTTTTTIINIINNETNNVTSTKTEVTESVPDEKPKEEKCPEGDRTAGCAELDTPDGEVPKQSKAITYQAENLGLGGGQCPPPFAWHDSLGNHAIDIAPLCDKVVTIVKPLILAFAALTCLFILMPGRTEA